MPFLTARMGERAALRAALLAEDKSLVAEPTKTPTSTPHSELGAWWERRLARGSGRPSARRGWWPSRRSPP